MEFLYDLVVALHLLGMAVIVGGWVLTRGAKRFPVAIVWAARLQLLTGILIVGLLEGPLKPEWELNYAKITTKLILALVVVAMAEIGNARSRKNQSARTQLDATGGAGLLATLVAALW
ncbi:hypothetical protein OO014_06865 [Intrasporangium calvum]|uniref:Integral membrane protein n=1 Tax=Intrasporangium calvum TaxID=53358 RepID=A0ABT5GFT5_9MICO|nr:hypothetical protein [Intrasporangium calvum]MDC5696977.1 hypothetical protein [Intrasporangium calvum]